MRLNINPTRMELIRLKSRLRIARQGHKLLKEKRDDLMKEFLGIIKTARELRQKLEEKLAVAFKSFVFASSLMNPEELEEVLSCPTEGAELDISLKNIMNIKVPKFEYKPKSGFLHYSLASTNAELDDALKIFSESLRDMIELAETEHSADLLASEIGKTRRRVNALEYIHIPNMAETIKYISAKLDEQERSVVIKLMEVKEKIAE